MNNHPKNGYEISNHEYHHGKTWGGLLSASGFKAFYTSPSAFRWPLPRVGKDFYDLGTEVHRLILQPETDSEAVVMPEWGFRSTHDKEKWYELAESLGCATSFSEKKDELLSLIRQDHEIITPAQIDTARDMAASVLENPPADELLASPGLAERSFHTESMRCRPDFLASNLLIDLKTCANIDRFRWVSADLLYPEQMAFYANVLRESVGIEVERWAFIAVESKPYRSSADGSNRHKVQVFMPNEDLIERTRERFYSALDDYHRCIERDEWPDAPGDIETLYPLLAGTDEAEIATEDDQ